MNPYSPASFFDLPDGPAAGLFEDIVYVWDAVAALPAYIEKIIEPELLGEVEEGAWLEPGRVRLEPGSRVERGAIVRGPTIIGRNTVIRTGAYIRGHALIGDDCVVGHGTELRQILMLNRSAIAHHTPSFTSLIGNRANIAGFASLPNYLLNGKEIEIRINQNGNLQSFPTGQTHFGAVIGDDSSVGTMVILQPGTVIGRRCLIYPQSSMSGYLPHDSLVRPKSATFEVIPRSAAIEPQPKKHPTGQEAVERE